MSDSLRKLNYVIRYILTADVQIKILSNVCNIECIKNCLELLQEVIPIYYCAFCGEEYDNKVNLFVSI